MSILDPRHSSGIIRSPSNAARDLLREALRLEAPVRIIRDGQVIAKEHGKRGKDYFRFADPVAEVGDIIQEASGEEFVVVKIDNARVPEIRAYF